MKHFLVIGVLILFISNFSLYSQQFSFGLYGGLFLPPQDFQNSPKTGFKIGADVELTYNGTFALFGAFNFNQGIKKEGIEEEFITTPRITVTEVSLGPRWYIGKGRFNAIIEGGLGVYTIHQNSYDYTFFDEPFTSDSYSTGGKFGFNVAAGANYKLTKKVDLCLKGKINYIAKNYGESFSNIYLGVRYNLR
jgi:hypothetical protein